MKTTPRIAITLACITILAACASGPKKGDPPAWIDGESAGYPSALYLTGRGTAADLQDAKDRARAELAKTFDVAVLEKHSDIQRFERTQGEGETRQEFTEEISRNLLTQTNTRLRGAEISEVWQDPQGRYHVLATQSRSKAREQFSQEIDRLDDQAGQLIERAEDTDDPLNKAALIDRAIATLQPRLAYQRSLQVVEAAGVGKAERYPLAQLTRARDEILARIRIHPSAEGNSAAQLARISSAAIANAGFNVADASAADYRLVTALNVDAPVRDQQWVWLRGTLETTLLDARKQPVGVERWPLKVSSNQLDRAQQRLLDKVEETLNTELRAALLGFSAD